MYEIITIPELPDNERFVGGAYVGGTLPAPPVPYIDNPYPVLAAAELLPPEPPPPQLYHVTVPLISLVIPKPPCPPPMFEGESVP